MIIIMRRSATQAEIDHVIDRIKALEFGVHLSQGAERTIIGAIGDERRNARLNGLRRFSGVERVVPILQPFTLVSRELHPAGTTVRIGGVEVGGEDIAVIAGPPVVEDRDQMMETARQAKQAGAVILHGGVFMLRPPLQGFQGLGEDGLRYLQEAGRATGLPVIVEVQAVRDLDTAARYADGLQIGAGHMANLALLEAAGIIDRPVILHRGPMATVEELLMSAEYVAARGNGRIIVCEGGIRTFMDAGRRTLDIAAVPQIKQMSHLPVIVEPSRCADTAVMVAALARAAIAAGADGLLLDVHPDPERTLSGDTEILRPGELKRLMEAVRKCVALENRRLLKPQA